MASPAKPFDLSGLPSLSAENIEQLDLMLRDLYGFLTQSPLGTSDAALDLSELADTGLLYIDASEDLASFGTTGVVYVDSADLPQALSTVGSVYINTSGVPASLSAATGNALISGGVGAVPSFGKIGLTTHVTGTLPIANGGTNNTTFNSGSVMFYNGTQIAEDNSGLFFDTSNDRLGIGAASPTEPLTVTHADTALAGVHFTSASGFGAFRLYEGSGLRGTLQFVGSTFATVGRRNNLELFNMHATGDITFHVQGSTTPSVTLNDAGNVLIANLTTGSVVFAGASGLLSQDNSNLFWDDTNKSLKLRGLVSGYPLEVHSSFASSAGFYTHSDTAFRAPATDLLRSRGTEGSPLSVNSADHIGYLSFYGYGGGDYRLSAGIAVLAAEAFSATNFGSIITFNTKSSAGGAYQERFRVTGSGILATAGTSAADTSISVGTLGDGLYAPSVGQLHIAANGSDAIQIASNQNVTLVKSIYVGATHYLGVNGRSLISAPADGRFVFSDNSGAGGAVSLAIGTTVFPATGTNGLIFGDGTALTSMGSNTAGLYADDVGGTVEMFGIGEGGNKAQLTGLNIRKTADESVTNSTTHQSDDHLTVNLAASSSYAFEIWGFWTTAGATAGITVQLDGTVGVSSLKADVAHIDNSTNAFSAFQRITAFNSAVGVGLTGDNSFYIRGVIETSTAGTFLLEWAQNSADAGNATTLQENSFLVLRKLNA